MYIWQPPSSTLALPAAVSTTPVNSSKMWENVFVGDAQAAKAHQEKLHADLKLRFDGGNGVGPARQPKKSSEERKREESLEILWWMISSLSLTSPAQRVLESLGL